MQGETVGLVLAYWLPWECWHAPVQAYKSRGSLMLKIVCEVGFETYSDVIVQV